MNEKWRPIKGFEGLYEVSTLGRIRSLERTVKREKRGTITWPDIILKPQMTTAGYPFVKLCKDYEKSNHLIHRLVCSAFLDNPEKKPHVNHKNGVRGDSYLLNLEWVTPSENIRHYHQVLKPMRARQRLI